LILNELDTRKHASYAQLNTQKWSAGDPAEGWQGEEYRANETPQP
jgi:hypothetical protein